MSFSCNAPPDAPSDTTTPPDEVPRPPSSNPPLGATDPFAAKVPRLSDVCLKAALDLRSVCAATGRVIREEAQTIIERWDAAHAQQSYAWAEDVFSDFRNNLSRTKPRINCPPVKGKKPVFNHEYTPLLEKYFEYNAYPSALDRAVLARKSMMTPRQIEVWFQNHRNRAKKDERPLRKLTEHPLPLEISLKSLEHKMPFFTVSEHERRPANEPGPQDDPSDDEDTPSISVPFQDPADSDVLNPPRPCHAFPTVYPPRCDYNPFPSKAGIHKFPRPIWFRTPATSQRSSKIPLDMEDFIADFGMKLHFRAPASKKRRLTSSHSWCALRTTIPPPAPHPAFVRSPISAPSSHTSSHRSDIPAIPATTSCPHPFRYPILFSQPTNPQDSSDMRVRRKVAHLPKRTPKNTSISHHHNSPAFLEGSPAPSGSSSYTSRFPSFDSDIPSERRTSFSSSSSTSSSTLTTPELPHAKLPDYAHSPSVSVAGLDFEGMDDLFGDRRETLPPSLKTPFNFSLAAAPKQSFPSRFEASATGHVGPRTSSHALPSQPPICFHPCYF
ncbi:hypothetical protein FPV67DRAFT_1466738 [Lyophyllum atratum]|nr:hypothetical protein FPV67DRAFT_1466738 [Lyophyllum atratum]